MRSTYRCPQCGGHVVQGSYSRTDVVCPYCEGRALYQPVTTRELLVHYGKLVCTCCGKLVIPRAPSELGLRAVGGVEVKICPRCGAASFREPTREELVAHG